MVLVVLVGYCLVGVFVGVGCVVMVFVELVVVD